MSRHIVFIYNDKPISFKELDYIIRGECVNYVKSPEVEIPFDIINEIVKYITKGSTFKVILQSCKRLYKLNKKNIPIYCNHLWTLIEAKIFKSLIWHCITINPNTTLRHINAFADEYIKNNKKIGKCVYKFDIHNLCQNPNITINEVKYLFPKIMDANSYMWSSISCNPGITMQDIEDNLDLPWVWLQVSRNPNLTIDFVLKHINKDWVHGCISSNCSITENDIERTMHIIYWNPSQLIYNYNITMEFIIKHFPDYVGRHAFHYDKFTLNQIYEYLQKEKLPGRQIMNDLSINENITIDLVLKYKQLEWCWGLLSKNRGIKLSDIDNHPELPWVWSNISNNPNLTAQYVINNSEKKWDWYMIMINEFNCS